MTWTALVVAGVGCYLLKLAGMSVPEKVHDHPVVRRIADLIPVVLLAALIAVQVFSGAGPDGPGSARQPPDDRARFRGAPRTR